MLQFVPIECITPNPHQPRGYFEQSALDALCASISKHGIIEPLILRKMDENSYQIIAGERRFRAAKQVGLKQIPAIIRSSTDSEMLELALIENLHREDMSPIDKARGFKKLMETFRYTQQRISEIMGMSRSAVANTIRLLDLPEQIQDALHRNQITEGHARAILCIKDPLARDVALRRILSSRLSVRETEELTRVIEKQTSNGNKSNGTSCLGQYEHRLIEELQEKLGTRVYVSKNGDTGKIEIEFYSEEDLRRIIEAL